jgi:hypothetical protein
MGALWEQVKKTLVKPLKELNNYVLMLACLDIRPRLSLSLG